MKIKTLFFVASAAKGEQILCDDSPAGMCPRILNPVCANDGKTYSNDCVLKNDFCDGKTKADEILFNGTCEDYERDCVKKIGKCNKVYKPICGSDGNTHSNSCSMNIKNCKIDILIGASKKINKKHKGECKKSKNKKSKKSEPKPEEAQLISEPEVNLKFGFGSSCFCNRMFAPVCGSDGSTYSNECMANCKKVKIVRHCSCEQSTCLKNDWMIQNGAFTPPEVEEPEEQEDVREIKPVGCICGRDFRPVCGANGQTYSNECEANCQDREIVKYCSCEQETCMLNDIMIENGKLEPKEIEEPEPEPKKPCICARILQPVCGVDGETYGNPCVAACDDIEIAKNCSCDDECESLIEEDADYDPEMPRKADPAPKFCACGRDYRPVCGVNGKTYSNECMATCEDVEVNHYCDCTRVVDGMCQQVLNDPFGFGFGGFGNDFVEAFKEELEEPKCVKSWCNPNSGGKKCGLINGEYKSFANWCELDFALCQQGGTDESESTACGMKRNGAFKIFATACEAELNMATVVDESLCEGAREFPENKKSKRRMQNDIFSNPINWRFRLIG